MRDRNDALRVLVADDDKLTSMILRRNLETMGLEVVEADNGNEAWNRIEAENFRLVISDWMMPGVSGIELCKRIRTRRFDQPYTYVILLTARSEQEDRDECYAAGADDFLAKPFERAELVARVSAARRILGMQAELERNSRQIEDMKEELQRQCARLAEVASVDGLTGLKNRRHFHDILDKSFSFASRHRLPLSVVLIDVDHFKSYNDSFGFPNGDKALSEIGRILQDSIREHDIAARYGGEEFVLILPGTDALGISQFSERVRARIEEKDWDARGITASFGATTSSIRTTG